MTHDQQQALETPMTASPAELNRIIAEALGWEFHMGYALPTLIGIPRRQSDFWTRGNDKITVLPNFSSSLDAMATAEATLTEEQFEQYAFWLAHFAPLGKQIVASALDRARAFVATIQKI